MKKSWSLKNFIPKIIPCLSSGYSFQSFKKDLMAGVTVGTIAYPFAIAISIGVGLAPQHGLYATIIGGFLASLLGGSRVLITGTTSTFIIALYSILARHGIEGLLAVTLLSGILLICFGIIGLGNFIKYMPYPVVTGLTTGISVIIFSAQIKDFLGLQMGSNVPVEFISRWGAYWDYLWTWDPACFIVGGVTIAIIGILKKYKPRLPGVMIALVIVTFFVTVFKVDVATVGTKYGTLPKTFPPFSFPHITFTKMLALMPDALTIAVLAGIETLLSAVIADGMTGWHHQSNCQLIAQGLANIGSSLFSGIPVTGSLSRTASNIKTGATTPIAGISHAIFLVLVLIILAPITKLVPLACLAAVLITIAWGMSDIRHFIHLLTAPKKDVLVLLAVFILTVLTNITSAVQVGMMMAAFLFMKQMSDLSDAISTVKYFDDDKSQAKDDNAINKKDIPDGVEIYEINGPFFFGIADRLKNLLNEIDLPPRIFILRMTHVPTIDVSAMHSLEEFYRECEKQGTTLLLAGIKKTPLKDLKRFHLDTLIGEDHIFPHIQPALEFSKTLLKLESLGMKKT